jgi:prolipoprotein diacylglyceryltransferase
MTIEAGFLMGLAFVSAAGLAWGFRRLPREGWQILAAVPKRRDSAGGWTGVNLTWYGVLFATAFAAAVALLVVLLGAVGVETIPLASLAATIAVVCMTGARFVARVVERRPYTFTVGGAVFLGVLVFPWILMLENAVLDAAGRDRLPALAVLAAFSIAHAYGEGLGRLACISFGCCYGRPVEQMPRLFRRCLGPAASFRFEGETKKVAYEGRLEGRAVAAVQGWTSVVLVSTALLATAIFLQGRFGTSLVVALGTSQGWRFVSEAFRADWRGGGRLSAYQAMAALSLAYAAGVAFVIPSEAGPPVQLSRGLEALWKPEALLAVQALWLGVFLLTGRSQMTASTLHVHVRGQQG